MVNLSLIELKSIKNKAEKRVSTKSYFTFNTNLFNTNLITVFKDNYIEGKDVTNDLAIGRYSLKSKFTIIFLYDIMKDKESREFIETYGGKLHNQSSFNITILTYYSSDMIKQWANVYFREAIKCGTNNAGFKVLKMIKNIQTIYDVKNLPAMIIVKKNIDETEESCNIDLSIYNNKETIYQVFKDIIEIIDDNCEENFSVISKKICGPETEIKKKNTISNLNTFNYVADLIKSEAKRNSYSYTQDDLAVELDISVRTLRNKRTNNSFTRDECLFLAIRFNISIKETNDLLRMNNHLDLGIEGKDSIIRKCLINGFDMYETDMELLRRGFNGIIKK